MITFFSKIFISKNADPARTRRLYGIICGLTGIFLNILLFAGKLFAGVVSGSIAITADALNNLSDAGSSAVTMGGFIIAGQRPDTGHPFGHGRSEYISGLIVAVVIMFVGLEMARSSVGAIISPETLEFSVVAVAALAVSILIKLYMAFYNYRVGGLVNSAAMRAVGRDSLSDCLATAAALFSLVTAKLFGWRIDGWAGVAVSLFILWSGFKSARETVNLLLGPPPETAFVRKIHTLVTAHEEVRGLHGLRVHDYGPDHRFVSLHVEVPEDGNFAQLHELIDGIEEELAAALDCEVVIHMDPG
jgi:cation diffusion facilitator family transporter